jgi:hypothetical protein
MKFVTKGGWNLALGCTAALTALTWGSNASAAYYVQAATRNETGITNNGTCNISDAIDCVIGGATGTGSGATCTASRGYHGCGGTAIDEIVFLDSTNNPTYVIANTQVIPAGVGLEILGSNDSAGDAFISKTGAGDAFRVASGGWFQTYALTILHSTASAGRGIKNSGTCLIEYTGVADGNVTGLCDSTHDGGCGGGIYNNGSFSSDHGIVYHNSATQGGGIYNAAGATDLNISYSTIGGDFYYTDPSGFRGNTASNDGGGVYNNNQSGTDAVIVWSTVSDNTAVGVGGGIASYGVLGLTLEGSTISGNRAVRGGGLLSGGRAHIENSTFSGNTATSSGGGGIKVVTGDNNYLELFYTTVAFNHSQAIGGGVDLAGAIGTGGNAVRTSTAHSIVAKNNYGAGNTASDYNGAPQTDVAAKSLFGVTPTNTNNNYNGSLNMTGDPHLAPLAVNNTFIYYPVKTHAIPSNSIAKDVVSSTENTTGSDTDERGYGRDCTNGGLCDLGAFEWQSSDP